MEADESLVPPDPNERNLEVSGAAYAAGAAAGLVGALLMELGAVIIFSATGQGGWWLSRLVAAAFLHGNALQGGQGADLLGLALHLAVGVGLGVVFAALLPRRPSRADVLALPPTFAVAVFVIMTYVVLSWADPIMFGRVGKGWFFLLHLLYGAALYLTLPLRDALLGGTRRPLFPAGVT